MKVSGSLIALTGATGFLGSYIALDLLSRGAKVRAVVRSPEKAKWLEERGCEITKANLLDGQSLIEAFKGADALIANAALYTLGRASWDAFYQANKQGTENVFAAAVASSTRRIVHISTCGVYRPRLFRPIFEDAPRWRERDRYCSWAYTVTKSIAEDVAWREAEKHGLALTVVRPAGIYGPRDQQAVAAIERFMRFPVLPVPTMPFPMSHAADIAHAVGEALANDTAVGRAYNLAGDPSNFWQLLRTWKRISGKGPLLIPIPMPFGMRFDSSAAKRDLAFSNRPMEEAIRDTVSGGSIR